VMIMVKAGSAVDQVIDEGRRPLPRGRATS